MSYRRLAAFLGACRRLLSTTSPAGCHVATLAFRTLLTGFCTPLPLPAVAAFEEACRLGCFACCACFAAAADLGAAFGCEEGAARRRERSCTCGDDRTAAGAAAGVAGFLRTGPAFLAAGDRTAVAWEACFPLWPLLLLLAACPPRAAEVLGPGTLGLAGPLWRA